MKLEKREISLNEYDSLKDAFYSLKTTLSEYVCALSHATRKETRTELLRLMSETGEDLFFVRDLMRYSSSEKEEEE